MKVYCRTVNLRKGATLAMFEVDTHDDYAGAIALVREQAHVIPHPIMAVVPKSPLVSDSADTLESPSPAL